MLAALGMLSLKASRGLIAFVGFPDSGNRLLTKVVAQMLPQKMHAG